MADITTKAVPADTTLGVYRQLLEIRGFEERCLQLGADTILGSIHLCGGQEAIPVGARAALRSDDRVVSTYRGHGWALAWGVPAREALAEIAHRTDGLNGGRAGSAYFMDPDRGFIGENSIVGAGVPIADGVAMAAQATGQDRVCVVSIGDGATNQGATHEGFNFAAVRKLPVIFIIENNAWSEMTPISETTRVADLAERAAGYGIPSCTVDGTDVLAVEMAVAEAADRARRGDGPTIIEARTVRLMAHYNRDIEHYRTEDDKAAARQVDPIPRLRRSLLDSGVSEVELHACEQEVAAELDAVVAEVVGMSGPDPATALDHVIATPSTASAATVVEQRDWQYWRAVNEALRIELSERPEVLVYGEDVGFAGGIFGVTRQLQRDFGPDRVFDTPISESAILGSAVGAAIEGLRPVVEIMWADFLFVALDQLVNQAANIRYVSRGSRSVPLVVRTQQGSTPGSCAQHSRSVEALLAHIPGLRVGMPSTPQDAYEMLRAAIADPDPVVIIESRSLYQTKGAVNVTDVAVPIGGAQLRRAGTDVAIISWGPMAATAEESAAMLATEGIDSSVLDLRWLNPLDLTTIDATVRASGGRCVVVHEATRTAGFGAEVAAGIAERLGGDLRAPVARVATPDTPMPAAPDLRAALVPSVDTVIAAARSLVRG